MRWLAIVNPQAGGGRCGRAAPAALQELRRAGLDIEDVRTQGPGHATTLARQAHAEGTRRFIAVGGDGTSFEVLNGLLPAAAADRVTLGFLPLGTGNSFMRDFSTDGAGAAARALRENRSRACDVIRLEHDDGVLHFLNLLSLGFVADVCSLANHRFKRLGEAGYGVGVVAQLVGLRTRAFPHQSDGQALVGTPLTFLSLCNSKFTGGKMMMAPSADTADGTASLVVAGHLGRWGLLRTFPKIFSGTHVHHPAVSERQVRSLRFELDARVEVMIDGEVLTLRPRRADVVPSALEVVV